MPQSRMRFALVITMLLAALLLTGAMPSFAQTIPPSTPEQVDKLIDVLKSDAPQKDKADACRQLAIIGTQRAVPALAALLADEKLSHMARYALEPIPEPAVDEALRDALGRLKGRPLVGVIGSIGARRDAKAVSALASLLKDSDADVVQAAARALGKIGTSDAAKALQDALPAAPAANQLAFCEGLMRAAEALAAKDRQGEALAIYDRLRGLDSAPHQVRAGALRGAILTRGKDGLALLREHLRSKDYILFSAAVQAAQELPGAEATAVLASELGQLPADNQVLVIQALGTRGDAALPTLADLATKGAKPVRLAAIRAYTELDLGWNAMFKLIDGPDPEIAQAARESLASLSCPQVDPAVMDMLDKGEPSRRLLALELIGRRRMTKAVPTLLKAAADTDAGIRQAALRRLGELGSPAQLPALVNLLLRAKAEELGAAEQALGAVCAKADDPQSCIDTVAALLAQAEPAQKTSLLRVLGAIGGANALKAVRAALDDPNAEVHAAAIRILSAWKTADAVPDLLALAQKAGEPTDRMLALRGYLGWAASAELPAAERLSMCRQAAGLTEKTEEKKLLLAALGTVASPDALALITPYLDQPATRDEAAAAAVTVAEKLLKGRNARQAAPRLIEPLKKVSQAAENTDLAERAKAALKQAQTSAGEK